MNVLMLGPSRKVKGGISTVVNNYYKAGIDERIKVQYLNTMEDGSKIKKLIVAVMAYLKFIFIVRRFSIIHIHMASRASFYRKSKFIKMAKRLNKRIIIHLHGAEFEVFYNNESDDKQKEFIKSILNSADRIIALSESWKGFLETIAAKEKIEVIYNCVPVVPDFKKSHDGQKMLFLGRVGKRKGAFDLLEIMPEIVEQNPKVKLFIGGDGEIDKLRHSIKENNLEKNVEYIGWVTGSEKDKYLKDADIYVLPSYNEGLPMALLEAMSFKCAVVTTNVGGIPEVIKHGVNGYIHEPGDKKKLKSFILDLIGNRDKINRISKAAYTDIVEKYSSDSAVDALIKIYNLVG